MKQSVDHIRRQIHAGLDLLMPPQCISCGAIVTGETGLCATCWEQVDFLGPPHCPRCGFPFEFDMGEDVLCGGCLRNPPVFDRSRAAFRYDDSSRKIVLDLKHGDRTFLAPALARLLYQAGRALAEEADILIPVPLHRWRLLRRRYNQSALLATELGKLAGKAVLNDAIHRHRATNSQGGLTRKARQRNLRGAFRLRPGVREQIAGRRILLVDDVLTTGATADATARCLLRGGATAVDVLTLARVVRPVYD